VGQKRCRTGHQGPKIRVYLKIAEVERSGLREVVLSLNAGIVDEAIHGTEPIGHLFCGALKRQSVGDIQGVGFDNRVSLADLPKGIDAPSRNYDSGALACERHSKPSANSGAATGDEAAFAGKCHGLRLTFRWRFTSTLPDETGGVWQRLLVLWTAQRITLAPIAVIAPADQFGCGIE
jgi:hypothetical protein